ncbi:unnamed protein product [Discosporangium mesarthrocarpum]
MRATTGGHTEAVTTLIEEGADMFATDEQGRTALDWARIAHREQVAKILEHAMENDIFYRREAKQARLHEGSLRAVVESNARLLGEMAQAINAQSLKEINKEQAHSQGQGISDDGKDGGETQAPLYYLDAQGKGGMTALTLACVKNDLDTVHRLIVEV